ncbi:S8 family peptidase [Roseisolibacter agri]|uniref:Serine protease n=1 Tax=Roseisolibacter agri TaxID=2014610 RepID=A0AA37QAP1_9BACT|nr:S8 family peptidase [Roseisolibacter agri]GLC27817.1 serine protease [Roseisolibacter agri]
MRTTAALRADSRLALAAAASAALVLNGCADPSAVAAPRASAAPAAADRPTLDRDGAPGLERVTLHVMFRRGLDDVPGRAARLADRHGGSARHVWPNLGGLALELPAHAAAAVLQRLAEDPDVETASPEVTFRTTTEQLGPTWGLDRIDERDRPMDGRYVYQRQGAGVHVYVMDTGILATHTEFGSRVGTGATFIFDGRTARTDCNGHGTHVASTVGGTTWGVAKMVMLHPIRVLGCDGTSVGASVMNGLEWILANGVRQYSIVNMSLGGGASSSLDAAVRNLVDAGFFVVVAAGNDNADACTVSPAREPKAYTVAASTSLDRRRLTSNFGPCVDIFAPGQMIVGASPASTTARDTLSGTSMAAPHVAGAAALLLSKGGSAYMPILGALLSGNASMGKITEAGAGSPNRLLYMGFID